MRFLLFSKIYHRLGLLILLFNIQLNLEQQPVAAKNAFRSSDTSLIAATKFAQTSRETASLCSAQLTTAIDGIVKRPQFSKVRWGILIQTLATGQNLYSRDAQKYFVPASNVKLLTTAAALQQLGAAFRIRTSIYGTNDGVLRVVGRGDPSLTDVQLRELAKQLNQRGVRQVKLIITEDNYFRGYTVNPSWEWEDVQADYGAPVNSLILNQNAVTLTLLPQQIGLPLRIVWATPIAAQQWQIDNESVTVPAGEPASISVSRDLKGAGLKIAGKKSVNSQPEVISLAVIDPKSHFLQHFQQALIVEEIKTTVKTPISNISDNIGDRLRLVTAPELATVESPPLSQLLLETNLNSNNLYAEALVRTLGVQASNTIDSTEATAEIGLRAVKATLTQMGVEPAGYILADGSGLSRHNLVTPEAIAQTLRAMTKSPLANIYRASLPVAGMSGTLKNRFQNTAAQGILQAKTGTMSGVVALSGYLNAPNYEPLIFSIIVNQSDQSAATLRQAIDKIVLLLTRVRRCEGG